MVDTGNEKTGPLLFHQFFREPEQEARTIADRFGDLGIPVPARRDVLLVEPGRYVRRTRLQRFLHDRKLGEACDLRVENISFGHSNEVHLVHFDGNSWALRRPPRGPLLPTAHDVIREFRVINALQDTPVPVP
jgi:hypothetical protein